MLSPREGSQRARGGRGSRQSHAPGHQPTGPQQTASHSPGAASDLLEHGSGHVPPLLQTLLPRTVRLCALALSPPAHPRSCPTSPQAFALALTLASSPLPTLEPQPGGRPPKTPLLPPAPLHPVLSSHSPSRGLQTAPRFVWVRPGFYSFPGGLEVSGEQTPSLSDLALVPQG